MIVIKCLQVVSGDLMKRGKWIKILFAILLVFIITDNVNAANFTCSALGDDVKIDYQFANIIRYVILIIQIIVPVILVVLGMLDFIKAVSSQKEDEIKKGQQMFIKRAIAGVLVFFVIAIVKLFISLLARGTSDSIMNCVNCFVKGPDSSSCG